jgi:DNA-binding transcriptional ArsR family regulator
MAIEAASAMKVLGNPRRLQILDWLVDPVAHFPPQTDGDLVEDGVCLVYIADKLGIAQPSASRHMELLTSVGCVTPKPIGRWTFYRRNEAGIAAALEAIGAALAPERGASDD